jgi:hypothetical protein
MKIWLIGWAEYVLTEIAFRIWDCGEADYEKFNERSLNFRVGRLFYRASEWVETFSRETGQCN